MRTLSVFMMAVILGFSTLAVAQDNKGDCFKVVDNVKETKASRQTKLGMDLVQYGYQNESALSLAQAAEIFAKYPIIPLVVKDEAGKAIATETPVHSYEPLALIKDAKNFSKKDANLLAYIDNVEENIAKSLSTKGETTVAGSSVTISLEGGESKTIALECTPFSINCVEARSRDYTDLELSVWFSMCDNSYATGTSPTVYFILGVSNIIYVSVKNLESSSTTVEIFCQCLDPDDFE